jgi:hypothetical protein
MMAKHPGHPVIDGYLCTFETGKLDEAIRAGKVPILLRLWDLNDEMSVNAFSRFLETYDAAEAGQFRTIFRRTPPCTLRTYGSWTDKYYLVFGRRPSKNQAQTVK